MDKILGPCFPFDRVRPASLKAYVVVILGAPEIKLVILAGGSHIHVENDGLNTLLESLLGNDRFFQSVHAAGARAIRKRRFTGASGPHTLNPGNFPGVPSVRGPHQLAQSRP